MPGSEREGAGAIFADAFEDADGDIGAAIRQDNHEFFAAVPCGDVVGSQRLNEQPREETKCLVARFVTVGIVQQLEAVETPYASVYETPSLR